ncbi:MAG: Mov34/MPN/PAD-1 family protein [Promethearchaeota archaeon]
MIGKVEIHPVALAKILEHTAFTNLERAGLLIGRLRNESLLITDAAITRQKGTATHVKLKDIDQASLAEFLRKQSTGEIVCGWYHSHPKMGADFFSSIDKDTQRRYQELFPNAVGLVVDPAKFAVTRKFKDADVHVYRVEKGKLKEPPFKLISRPEEVVENTVTVIHREKAELTDILDKITERLRELYSKTGFLPKDYVTKKDLRKLSSDLVVTMLGWTFIVIILLIMVTILMTF